VNIFEDYCELHITEQDLEKEIVVDTYIYPFEFDKDIIGQVTKLAPF
jgi:hypothetical protein